MTTEQYDKASDILNKIAELANENDEMSRIYAGIGDSQEEYVSLKIMVADQCDSWITLGKKRMLSMLDAYMRDNHDKIVALRGEFEAL